MSGLEFHPLADLFPMLDDEEQGALAADIRDHGLHAPIATYEGKILDGRNRYRACQVAGVNPAFKEYKGDDPLGYVVSLNMVRRHLDGSQRAMIAAKIETLKHGGNRQDANLHLAVSRDEAARMLNVSPRSVASAAQVLESGDPDMIASVEHGDLAVSAAANAVREALSPPSERANFKEAVLAKPYSKTAMKYFAKQEGRTLRVTVTNHTIQLPVAGTIGPSRPIPGPARLVDTDEGSLEWIERKLEVAKKDFPSANFFNLLGRAHDHFTSEADFAAWLEKRGIDGAHDLFVRHIPAPVLVDDQSIAWLEEHRLAAELHSARAGGSLDNFVDFLSMARSRLPDEAAFFTWLAKHKIELAADLTIEERAALAIFRSRRKGEAALRRRS
jgi:hypothetical protein